MLFTDRACRARRRRRRKVTVSTDRGSFDLPAVAGDIADDVVWVPTSTHGVSVHRTLGAGAGASVRVAAAGSAEGGSD